MGVPKYSGLSMTEHPQYITVRYYPFMTEDISKIPVKSAFLTIKGHIYRNYFQIKRVGCIY
jgi:hypothetical protein